MAKATTTKPVPESPSTLSAFTQAIELIACTVAIYLIYLTYGIYHEKIPNHNYGTLTDPERFKFPLFLTTVQCIGNSVWALVLITFEAARRTHTHPGSYEPFFSRVLNLVFDQVPKSQYLLVATSYALSSLSSTSALNYLSYLIQALAKSSKLIPVMAGKMIRGHRYSPREYLHVLLITGGIVLFILDPNKSSKQATSIVGVLLIVFSLSMDAITGPTQDAMNDKYKPSVSAMTFWINVLPAIAFWIASYFLGEWSAAIEFLRRHPAIQFEIVVYCVLAAIGQTIILIALFKFDSMTLTIITTTRKFISILASVFWFGHTLQITQWIGVVMVFTGIGADSHLKYVNKHKRHHKKPDDAETDGPTSPPSSPTTHTTPQKKHANRDEVDVDGSDSEKKRPQATKRATKKTAAADGTTKRRASKKAAISSGSDEEEPIIATRTTRSSASKKQAAAAVVVVDEVPVQRRTRTNGRKV